MSDTLDDFVNKLQTEIDADALATYGQAAYERWKAPRCMFAMADPDAHGRVTGAYGDTLQIYLKFADGRVGEASFTTDGCGPSVICGAFAAEAARGREPEGLADISGDTILEMAGGLPADDRHCAFLAAAALQAALDDYMGRQVKQTP